MKMKKYTGTLRVTGEYEIDINAESEEEANIILEKIASDSFVTPSTLQHKSWMDIKEVTEYSERFCDVDVEDQVEEV
jgi:DNA-binding transcriptional regulator WhiA